MKWSHFAFVVVVLLLLSLILTFRMMQNLHSSSSSSVDDDETASPTVKEQKRKITKIQAIDQKDETHEEDALHTTAAIKKRPSSSSPHQNHPAGHDHSSSYSSSSDSHSHHPLPTYAAGRDKNHHNEGLERNSISHVAHAWGAQTEHSQLKCHGTDKLPSCVTKEAYDYASKHILFVIITGADATFRVEVSQCTWLSQLPPQNVLVITDSLPHPKPRTPHQWIRAKLPDGMTATKNGDFVSEFMPKGYLHAVKSAGQGYGASWIAAQTRFTYGLHVAAKKSHVNPDIRWVMLMDDDTIVQLDHLVNRVKLINDTQVPWYFSRKGWGGAGHLYSRNAMERVHDKLHECVDKWFVRQFRASDTLLLKCAGHLKLRTQMEGTMSHCPASSKPELIESTRQISMHGKKDFYPPILLATWRISLYYLSMYCRSPRAMKEVVVWSACTYGASCKRSSCDKVADERRERKWKEFSKDETIENFYDEVFVPGKYLHDIRVPTKNKKEE